MIFPRIKDILHGMPLNSPPGMIIPSIHQLLEDSHISEAHMSFLLGA
jgi:hypothetical protein